VATFAKPPVSLSPAAPVQGTDERSESVTEPAWPEWNHANANAVSGYLGFKFRVTPVATALLKLRTEDQLLYDPPCTDRVNDWCGPSADTASPAGARSHD